MRVRGGGGEKNRKASFIMSLDKRDGGSTIYDGLIQEQIAETCVNIS